MSQAAINTGKKKKNSEARLKETGPQRKGVAKVRNSADKTQQLRSSALIDVSLRSFNRGGQSKNVNGKSILTSKPRAKNRKFSTLATSLTNTSSIVNANREAIKVISQYRAVSNAAPYPKNKKIKAAVPSQSSK